MKPVIHIVIWIAQPGGLEKVITFYLKYLTKKYQYNLLSLRPSESDYFCGYNCKIQFGSSKKLLVYFKLFSYAKRHKKQIFHLFNGGPLVLATLVLAGCKKIVYHIHGTKYWKTKIQKFILLFFWRLSIRPQHIFIANSEFSKKVFNNNISSKTNVRVLYNPFITTNQIKSRNKRSINRVCYVGRLVHGKNLFTWLNCASALKNRFKNIEFHIYGEGLLRAELEKQSCELRLGDFVTFHGFVKDIDDVYKENDLLMFLSEYESFGNVVVESILAGTPVIVSQIPSHEEILSHYPEFMVPLDKRITLSVVQRFSHFDALKKSTDNARKEFKKRFSIKQHLDIIEDIYLNLSHG